MLLENDAVSAKVGTLAGAACVELFDAYGVRLVDAPGGSWEHSDEAVLSGSMGFVGPRLRGTCLLASSEGPLIASCPAGGRPKDWIGELTNQLVGRLKTKLLARGVEVFLSTPIVLTGARIRPVPRGLLTPTVLACAEGHVLVWLEAESGQDLTLVSEHPSPNPGSEGDIFIF
jgi:hypothetical protein